MILIIGKKKFLKYLESEHAKIDKNYLKGLREIDEMPFAESVKAELKMEAFWETKGRTDMIIEMINKLM